MSTLSSNSVRRGNSPGWNFWLVGLALTAGLILSILSWIEFCVEHCSANEDYRLFGLPFSMTGIGFFSLLIVLHFTSLRLQFLSRIVEWLVASSLGAEIMFIALQKYQIGHWCPVCLSIAASVAAAALGLLAGHFKSPKVTTYRGETMQKIKQGFTCLSFILIGFLMAFIGISKPNSAEAAINNIKERIAFGTKNSPVEVYFISDWFCPSCKKVESQIEKIYPEIKSKVTFYFIDYPIHKKSINFSPYNLAFLMNNKSQYFKARRMLLELAEETESPKDEDIVKAARKNGLVFKELDFVDIKSGLEYFDTIVDKYNLSATPTIIITNPRRNSVVKLEGRDEISEEQILNAIEKLSPSK